MATGNSHPRDLLSGLEAEEKEELEEQLETLQHSMVRCLKKYQAAMREMRVRFEILDDDLELQKNRNPIHHIESRLKKSDSIFDKVKRYGIPQSIEGIEENIFDIAGIRVVCSYIDDVYAIMRLLNRQDDLEIMRIKDYIKNPKPNGYRSLHIIVRVPIYFMDRVEHVPVEVQIRTVAMDFWASLEHELRYKATKRSKAIDMSDELKNCSEVIEDVEKRMQILMHAVEDAEEKTLPVEREEDDADIQSYFRALSDDDNISYTLEDSMKRNGF